MHCRYMFNRSTVRRMPFGSDDSNINDMKLNLALCFVTVSLCVTNLMAADKAPSKPSAAAELNQVCPISGKPDRKSVV